MRLASILLSAILLQCLFIQTHAYDPGDIAIPSMPVPNMNMPEPLISKPNMDVLEQNPKIEKPSDNPNRVINQTGNVSSNQSLAQIQQGTMLTDVSGKWSIKFSDATDKLLILNLWSSGGDGIMGYGTLTDKGRTNSVTASGSIIEEELTLNVKSGAPEYANQNYDEYYLDMFIVNKTLSGTYVLKSGEQSLSEGNVTAAKQ